MNATNFLANISKSLQSLDMQINSINKSISIIPVITNETKKLQKNVVDMSTLMQQQANSINEDILLLKDTVNQLKVNQENVLIKMDEIMSKLEVIHTNKQQSNSQ